MNLNRAAYLLIAHYEQNFFFSFFDNQLVSYIHLSCLSWGEQSQV